MAWYQELFKGLARTYDGMPFVQETDQEVGFIEELIEKNRSLRILDLGCGTGRHAVELVRRGYSVIGCDLSWSQLERASEKARDQALSLPLILADARQLSLSPSFDVAIMLCEGAFCLMETDQMNFRILQNLARVLKPGGVLIMTALNALYALAHGGERGSEMPVEGFDPATFRACHSVKITDDSGKGREVEANERFYAPSELTWLLQSVGMEAVAVFGCQVGRFSRELHPSADTPELMAIARRAVDIGVATHQPLATGADVAGVVIGTRAT